MIWSFKDQRTERLFNGFRVASLPEDIQRTAMRKLKLLHNATSLNDLRIPPGNRLEALEGRQGYFSIRINIQWRITFRWNDGAEDVKIEDYH